MSKPFSFYVPVLTLVNAAYEPLEGLIEAHLQFLKAHGVEGILVLGTTGAFPNFSVAQRQRYLEAVLRVNPGLTLMVNVGAASLADIQALQAHANAQPHVDQLLLMPPFYFPGDQINGLDRLLAMLLEVQPKPFYLYHFPKMSQVDVTPALLAQFPQIAGLKDTSGDFNRIGELVKHFPDKAVYVGTDVEITKSKALGCTGVISGMANVFPQLTQQMLTGNTEAEALMSQVRSRFIEATKLPALTAYLNHLNLSPEKAVSTLPFRDLDPAETQALVAAAEELLPNAPLPTR